jgi:hypothetical protein
MFIRVWLCSALLLPFLAYAYPAPSPGTENIPKLMSEATLVCKGLIEGAPPLTSAVDPPRFSTTATFHAVRCFKGEPPSANFSVLFDGVLPAGGGPALILRTGDYVLLFLKPKDGEYLPIDQFFGALPISRISNPATDAVKDPMRLLESDLKAGLDDDDEDLVLDSIRMLWNMRHLQSTRELKALQNASNPLVRTYAWEALLRLGDYSVLKDVGEFFATEAEAPQDLFLPRDRLKQMQYRLANQIIFIKDPDALPQLEKFLFSPNHILRTKALQAVRRINSPHSAPVLYKLLEDGDVDNRFGAMQGLLSLAGGGYYDWVPSWEVFREDPDFYVAACRIWWEREGKYKIATRMPPGLPSIFPQ